LQADIAGAKLEERDKQLLAGERNLLWEMGK
jgi:hypothetical protein